LEQTIVDNELMADRLERFFASWKVARTTDHSSKLLNKLTRFFEQFRSLAGTRALPELESPVMLTRQPRLEDLQKTLRELRPLLTRARLEGAFLNIWSTAGLKRDEVRTAAVLASLFDPQSHPESGPDFLLAFLQRAGRSSKAPLLSEAEVRGGYTVRTEDYPSGQSDNRVDLSIEGRTFLLIIEVKIDAGEGPKQLCRYDKVLHAKAGMLNKRAALIYLSPLPPLNPPPGTVHATWTDVVFAARQVGRMNRAADRSLVASLLLHFADHVTAFH
jgi:PD-(D/E)XK nuclease superfamily